MDESIGNGNLPSFYTKPTTIDDTRTSDSMNIEFDDDQISAHSSRSDSFGPSPGLSRPSDLISRLFQKHTLDLSVLASSANYSDYKSVSNLNGTTTTTTTNRIDESFNLIGDVSDDLIDTKCLHRGETTSNSAADVGNDSIFISGDAALELFAKDEEVFKKETEFMIPNNPAAIVEDVGLGQSWIANSVQDVTRPSWLSPIDERTSRVSIGTLMRAKTEPLGCLSGDGGVERPYFGLDSASPPRDFKPLSETCLEEQVDSTTNESVVSASAISMAFGDVTASADPKSLVELLLKMDAKNRSKPKTKTKKKESVVKREEPKPSIMLTKRGEATGASFTSNVSNNKSEVRAPNPPKDDWVVLETNKDHKNVQTEMIFEPSICQIPLPPSPPAEKTFSNRCRSSPNFGTLQLLRSFDSTDEVPTLNIPKVLSFTVPCCVGLTSNSRLIVTNPTLRFIELKTTLISVSCDGHGRIDALNHSVPIFEADVNGLISEPIVPNKLVIKFNPTAEGKWEGQMNISCRFVEKSKSDWVFVSSITIEATAICPMIQMVPCDVVDFGVLPEGALQSRSLLIVNKSTMNIPVRLIIEGTTSEGHGYYFVSKQTSCSPILKCVLSESDSFVINLKAPTISKYDDEMAVVRKNLRVELDSPTGEGFLLSSMLLSAVVGIVRLCTRQDVNFVTLQPSHELPIQNRGPIPLDVELSSPHPESISVVPSTIRLMPQQQELLCVRYHSKNLYSPPFNSQIEIKVQPKGPVYKINVVGLPLSNNALVQPLDETVLQSDRHNLFWGTVCLKERAEKIIVLFNTSHSITLNLRLAVSDGTRKTNDPNNNSPPFQIAIRSSGGFLTFFQKTNVTILPMQKLALTLVYAPIAVVVDYAQLVIKFANLNDGYNDSTKRHIKFTIPLRGCGGGANVRWDGICPTPSEEKQCDYHVDRRAANGEFHLLARNMGQRAAFVKIVPSNHPSTVTSSSLQTVTVRPSHFILQEGACQNVTVICNSSSISSPFYLGLIIGDEILRQKFRLFRSMVSSSSNQIDELEQLLLTVHFLGGSSLQSFTEDNRWLPTKSDRQLLLANMKTKWVAVLPSVFTTPYEEEPSGIFRPLIPEQTFNETSTFIRPTATSPPTNEKSTALITVDENSLKFPKTKCGDTSTMKLGIKNKTNENEVVTVTNPMHPFYVKFSTLTIKAKHYLSLPVYFRPMKPGFHSSQILLKMSNEMVLSVVVSGEAI